MARNSTFLGPLQDGTGLYFQVERGFICRQPVAFHLKNSVSGRFNIGEAQEPEMMLSIRAVSLLADVDFRDL